MHRLLILIYGLFISSGLLGQESPYLFTPLDVKEGLAPVQVHTVQQDQQGFIWIGGNNSLQRYDGHRFLNFYIGKNREIPGGVLRGMAMDSTGRLWLLTGANNLGYLRTTDLTYHAVKISTPPGCENSYAALQVNRRGGVILIYVGKTIATYNEAVNEVSVRYNEYTPPKGWEPWHVWQDEYDNYWTSTLHGLLKYNTRKKLMSYWGHNDENDPVIARFGSLPYKGMIFSRKNIIWLSFDKFDSVLEIFSMDTQSGEVKEWHQELLRATQGKVNYIWGCMPYPDGSHWMNGPDVFAEVDYKNNRIRVIEPEVSGAFSIRYKSVNNHFMDREGTIWVCTSEGLFRFNPSSQLFRSVPLKRPGDEKPHPLEVTSILSTQQGEVVVATWGEGSFFYNQQVEPIESRFFPLEKTGPPLLVNTQYQRKNGDIWQAVTNFQVMIHSFGSRRSELRSPYPEEPSTVRSITEDKEGNMWLGTAKGQLFKWEESTNRFKLVQRFKRMVSRLMVDHRNQLWACTDDDGVYCLDTKTGKTIHYYTEQEKLGKGLLINGASDILEWDDSTIVIASNGLNLLNTRTGKFTYLDEGASIYSLILDKQNRLWYTTRNAIACRMKGGNEQLISFDAKDGIASFDFEHASVSCLDNGLILVGTSTQMIKFDPEKVLQPLFSASQAMVAEIVVDGKRVNVDSILKVAQIVVPHRNNSLIFRLTTNEYQNIRLMFYKIEGVDEDWRIVPADGEIDLSYLPAGKYVFHYANANPQFKAGDSRQITIHLKGPFYKTWWFYSLLVLLTGGVLFGLDRERARRKEKVQAMRSNIASNLHQEVNSALHHINILSEMARLKANQEPEKTNELIEQIQDKSRQMITGMEDMLWAIDPKNDSMEKTMERIREFTENKMNSHALPILFTVDERIKQMNLPMDSRHKLFLLVKKSVEALLELDLVKIRIQIGLDKGALLGVLECQLAPTQPAEDQIRTQQEKIQRWVEGIQGQLEVTRLGNNLSMEYKIPLG